jgi:hypothetical protein
MPVYRVLTLHGPKRYPDPPDIIQPDNMYYWGHTNRNDTSPSVLYHDGHIYDLQNGQILIPPCPATHLKAWSAGQGRGAGGHEGRLACYNRFDETTLDAKSRYPVHTTETLILHLRV